MVNYPNVANDYTLQLYTNQSGIKIYRTSTNLTSQHYYDGRAPTAFTNGFLMTQVLVSTATEAVNL